MLNMLRNRNIQAWLEDNFCLTFSAEIYIYENNDWNTFILFSVSYFLSTTTLSWKIELSIIGMRVVGFPLQMGRGSSTRLEMLFISLNEVPSTVWAFFKKDVFSLSCKINRK